MSDPVEYIPTRAEPAFSPFGHNTIIKALSALRTGNHHNASKRAQQYVERCVQIIDGVPHHHLPSVRKYHAELATPAAAAADRTGDRARAAR